MWKDIDRNTRRLRCKIESMIRFSEKRLKVDDGTAEKYKDLIDSYRSTVDDHLDEKRDFLIAEILDRISIAKLRQQNLRRS